MAQWYCLILRHLMVRICLDWGWVIQCWSMKFCEMRDLMLIDEGLWDELVFFFVHRGLSSMHAQVTCAFEMEELARYGHGTLEEILSFRNETSNRRMEQSIGLLFSVHDSQFSMQIQAMWRCYEWCASYRTKPVEDQAELAPCRGSAPLFLLHACGSKAHCMLRSSLSWGPDP